MKLSETNGASEKKEGCGINLIHASILRKVVDVWKRINVGF